MSVEHARKPSERVAHRPRAARAVVPRSASFKQRALATILCAVIRVIYATERTRLVTTPAARDAVAGGPVIFAIWHNRFALSLELYNRFCVALRPGRRMAALVSASRDGAVAAHALKLFGVQPVRGSSSRRGPQALLEMTNWAERGYDLAITPDGPRGPRYVVQDGTISVAQVTGLPIIPTAVQIGWKREMPSWDRFHFPLPFSKVALQFADPLRVPRDATDVRRAELRRELEERLKTIAID